MIDYEYYSNVYYGDKVSDGRDFNRFAGKAERTIANTVNADINEITDRDVIDMIKFTICELIDYYHDYDLSGDVKSESLGDFSITYAGTQSVNSIIHNGLIGTGLITTPKYRALGTF